MTDATPVSLPTVQLLHELPDGSAHVDWMIAPDATGRTRLVTFRLGGRVDELSPAHGGVLEAERIADHRTVYLDYEGPLTAAPGASAGTADRGRVRCLRRGRVVEWNRGASEWQMTIIWEGDGTRQRLRLDGAAAPRWRVTALSSREREPRSHGIRKEPS